MTLPRLGVALRESEWPILRDWILAHDRAVEIQDFVTHAALADAAPLVERWRAALDGHTGERGLHGPFFGLDISNPDPEIRAVIQRRLLDALGVAEALAATHMVVHSPFTFWHALNYANYQGLREDILGASAECLAPVLARAGDIGCTVMLENIDDADPADRVDLVARIDHPRLMVSLDTGHAELAYGAYRAPPVVDFVLAAGARLGHVHLQDADGHADRHWHPGEGRVPWGPVFAALAETPARLILEVRARHGDLPRTVERLEALGIAC